MSRGRGATPFQTDILVSYRELTAAICKTPLKNFFLCVFLRFFAFTLPNLWRYWDVQKGTTILTTWLCKPFDGCITKF
jgi:hypothetical protein